MPTKPDTILTVRIPDDIIAAMARLKKSDGMLPSEQIRRGLVLLLTKKGVYVKKVPKKK